MVFSDDFRRLRTAVPLALFMTAAGSLAAATMLTPTVSAARVDTPVSLTAGATPLAELLWPASTARLIDQDGHTITPAMLKDKVVVVSFFTTRCLAACAIRQLELTHVLQALPPEARDRVLLVSLSDDIAHDTPAALKAFASDMRLDPKRHFLVAAGAGAERMKLLQWRPPIGAPDPVPPMLFAFDRKGELAMRYLENGIDRRRLVQDLETLSTLQDGVGTHTARSRKSS